MGDNNMVFQDHAGDDHVSAGRMGPWFPSLVAQNYYSTLEGLICPTAPGLYAFGGYTSDIRNDKMAGGGWNNWQDWFWQQRKPLRISDPNNPFKDGYSAIMGTYFYWGGASADTNTNRYWAIGVNFRMRSGNVRNASRYAILWDQNPYRKGGLDNPAYSSHQVNPGASYAFFDGHVKFVPDSEYAWCTAFTTSGKFMHTAEHVTPSVNSASVMYNSAIGVCGKIYYTRSEAKTVVEKILALP